MNYKRKGPKSTRSGCLSCKPNKHQGNHKKNRVKSKKEKQEAIDQYFNSVD